MLIKQLTKKGEKYYVNAFTGVEVKIPFGDPLKREADSTLQGLMAPKINLGFAWDYKKVRNARKSAFMGDFVEIMKVDPEKRDVTQFILICKRVNKNPWELMEVTYWEYYGLDKPVRKPFVKKLVETPVQVVKLTWWSSILNFVKRLF